jgi:hypothetical protein
MIDEQLSRAVRLLIQARLDEFYDRMKRDAPRISVEDRFMAAIDSPDAARLLPLAKELVDGAYAVGLPPEGFEAYKVALRNWMDSHEEIDPEAWVRLENFLRSMNIH